MKLIATSRSAKVYALMKFSKETVEIVLLAFPRSARMRVTGRMQTVVYDTP